MHHAVATCRMGVDAAAVVGPDLRLHGMDGLRVVDASAMPVMVSANMNAATLMIVEKASDMILADRRLGDRAPATGSVSRERRH